jgi:hypothetical protein
LNNNTNRKLAVLTTKKITNKKLTVLTTKKNSLMSLQQRKIQLDSIMFNNNDINNNTNRKLTVHT